MRYTEHDFTIDHIFDFIRIAFSSVFLAPFRLVNEYSKKVLFIDKEHIQKHLFVALGINILLIIFEIIGILKAREFIILTSNIPGLLFSFILIGGIYYLSQVIDQPKINYGTKPKKQKVKQSNKSVYFDAEELIEDKETEDEEVIMPNNPVLDVKPSEEKKIDLSNIKINLPKKENLEMDFGFEKYTSSFVNKDELPDTPKDILENMNDAYNNDEFGMGDLIDDLDEVQEIDPGEALSQAVNSLDFSQLAQTLGGL